MEIQNQINDKEKEKYLFIFEPPVFELDNTFLYFSILTGTKFISIILLVFSFLYFYNSLYMKELSVIFSLIFCLIYLLLGGFLLVSTFVLKYEYAKISFLLYETIFLVKLLDYVIIFIINLINFFYDFEYYAKVISSILGGTIELGVMCYFIFVIYRFIYIVNVYNNENNKVGAEYQVLLKDNNYKKENINYI